MSKNNFHEKKISNVKLKRLHLFIPTLEIGGAQRFFVNLANYFSIHHHVTLYTLMKGGALEKTLFSTISIKYLVENKDTTVSYRNLLTAFFRTIKIFKSFNKGDAVISTLTGMNIFVCVSRLLSRKKIPLVIREAVVRENRRSKTLSLLVYFYRYSDCIVAVSKEVKNDLLYLDGIDEKKIKVINNPIDSKKIRNLANQSNTHPWFDDPDTMVIVAVGRLVYQKGFDVLIKAMSIVITDLSAKLIIIGDGELKNELLELCQELQIEQFVDFLGEKENPYSYMSKSDLFVLPSRWEGFVNVLVEGVLCAPRVVSSNCRGGPDQILEGGLYGKLFKSEDEKSLATAIIESFKHEKNKDISEWLKKYEMDNIFKQYLQLLN
jgi:glycosyltransferase involved in cell wall biosynthesis